MIAALYVAEGGTYYALPGVDPWPEARDARASAGPHPVVAHPPCAAWGRYARPTPASTARGPLAGDDGGCFAAALAAVHRFGGVVEHPAASKAWAAHGIPAPPPSGWARRSRRGSTSWPTPSPRRSGGDPRGWRPSAVATRGATWRG